MTAISTWSKGDISHMHGFACGEKQWHGNIGQGAGAPCADPKVSMHLVTKIKMVSTKPRQSLVTHVSGSDSEAWLSNEHQLQEGTVLFQMLPHWFGWSIEPSTSSDFAWFFGLVHVECTMINITHACVLTRAEYLPQAHTIGPPAQPGKEKRM